MEFMKRLALLALGLLVAGAVSGGILYYQQTHQKISAEVISYDSEYNVVFAVREDGALFTFLCPENLRDEKGRAEPEALRCGALITVTGPGYWLLSEPAQYPNVSAVKITGYRADFVALHYNTLRAEYAGADRETLTAAIQQLPDLTDGEQRALLYLLNTL